MAARIVLIRHGPSALVHGGGVTDRAGVESWRVAQDLAGIQTISQPPPALLRMAAEATHVIASDLCRAVRSAERLVPERPVRVSALLRETPLAIPHVPVRLPLWIWETIIHLDWGYRILRGTDTPAPDRTRAKVAAEWLAGIVGDGSTVLVVTHGVFRRLLAKRLLVLGWTSTGRSGRHSHWSSWSFAGPVRTRETERAAARTAG